ncbi:MAG: cysteine desulfurase [Lachnospiraceae bacterium]|nr:cysteine desulfurase [Lachnospiraceae bacterium]
MPQEKEFIAGIRRNFPLIEAHPEIAYLDNAATSQKPAAVLMREKVFYEQENANPLRGLYALSVAATDAYENAREAVRRFIGAGSTEEIVFTRNATESLNLAAYCVSDLLLHEGDEILITIMEHHSNLLPWQQAAKRKGAFLRFIECGADGLITEESFRKAVTPKTKIVAMTQISNVLGVRNDVGKFAAIAHENGAVFVCDGAQSVPHIPVDVRDLDVDFLAFSGHKMLGPMGIGVLYGKKELLSEMQPFLYGGEMIEYVTRESATYAPLPHRFEAGTVNAAGAAGLHEAIRFYEKTGFDAIVSREEALSRYAMKRLKEIPYLRLLGPERAEDHNGIFTFTMEGVHPHDIAAILDADGVCIRAGHHCAQPLLAHLRTRSTVRASLAFYNTEEEIDRLAASLSEVRRKMGYAE